MMESMKIQNSPIRIPLFIGAGYFLLVSIAHAFEYKIPGLFIYFNVPSYAYQDKIISLLAFGWSVFFYYAAKTISKNAVKAILVCGIAAIIMLFTINFSGELTRISGNKNVLVFNIQAGIFVLYWLWIAFAYGKIGRIDK
jgi:hypothetical protein